MSSKFALSVSLTEHLSRFIEEQVASGRFSTSSEVVRAGLRLLERDMAGPAPARDNRSGATVADAANHAAARRSAP
jgi:antitoxin ParD1/3/4